ncbi:MAG: GNAT family N-acetyltransferase [Candidatus Thorarchaeota archaeon]|nr:GNAT family N-acetyltransferase [Candidatus Thorarchaeota archaeon]
MKIVQSKSWVEYKALWKNCMKDYYWYKEDPVFDWNKHEELEEMETEFSKPGRFFLEAHSDGFPVGVLGLRYTGKEGALRRWEPASVSRTDGLEVERELLLNGLDNLSKNGVERVKVIVKYPSDNPDVAKHLTTLYQEVGFNRYQPDSVDLVIKLDSFKSIPPSQSNIKIDPHQGTIPENIGEFCVRAYASTPEDREIHGFDTSVSDYDTAVEVFRSILGGGFGPSPSEFWKVALVEGEPAGFIGGFIRESKHNPLTGIFGPVGVFPEYRRLGLGLYLASELFKSMRDYGCKYAAVGTPANNHNAIKMYQKAGFKLNCHLVHLEKNL